MTHLRRGGLLNSLMIEVQGQVVEREIPSEKPRSGLAGRTLQFNA